MAARRVAQLAFAVASDGTLLVNVAGQKDVRHGRRMFVGVPLTAAESRRVLQRLDDAAHESVALVLAARTGSKPRRRRRQP